MKASETKLKVMKDCNLNDRDFKVSVMKKHNDIKENSEQ